MTELLLGALAPFFADLPFTFKPFPTLAHRDSSLKRVMQKGEGEEGERCLSREKEEILFLAPGGHSGKHLGDGVLAGGTIHREPDNARKEARDMKHLSRAFCFHPVFGGRRLKT